MNKKTAKEISGFKKDLILGTIKQSAEKESFEKKLLNDLGKDMEETLEHPDLKKDIKFAKKYNRKKRWAILKENIKRIFGGM